MTDETLRGLRVVELGGVAPAVCGRWLAAFGAEVVKVEPPDGDWMRRYNPPGGEADPRAEGALFRYLSAGKKSRRFDLEAPDGRERLAALLADADLVLHCLRPGERSRLGVDREALRALNPRLVEVWMPSFPPEGPYARFEGAPIVLLALGGYQFLTGQPGREPLALPGTQPEYLTGLYGVVCALAGLFGRAERTGHSFRVSELEALASLHQFTTVMWMQQGIVRSRHGNRWENLYPITMLPTGDGYVGMAITTSEQWERFAAMIGQPELVVDERFAIHPRRHANADALDEIITRWLSARSKLEVFREGQESWRLPVGPMLGLPEVLADPQYESRAFFVRPDGAVEQVRHPGLPAQMTESEWTIRRSPALGEHDDAPAWSAATPRFEVPAATSRSARSPRHPLAGVRVLDFTRVWSGPLCARILADLGAEVIKVEAPVPEGILAAAAARVRLGQTGEPRKFVRGGNFQKLNRNRLGVCIDLQNEKGRDLVRALVARSDALVENFSARVMPNFGLGYDDLRKANPALVMLSMPGFGARGPYRDYLAYGPAIEPMTGLSSLLGYPGEEPSVSAIAYPDAVAGVTGAAAIVIALAHQRRTGRGQHIDLSQTEAMIGVLGEYFVACQETGAEPPRTGNKHPHWAPQGTYRCEGDDEWVSIAVRSDREWMDLCRAARLDDLLADAELRTEAGRRGRQDEVDRAIGAWTATRMKFAVMNLLQGVGVPAGAVLNGRELVEDPQLAYGDFFVEATNREGETARMPGTPVVIDGERREDWLMAPRPGEHNRQVLHDLIGLSDAEIDALEADGALGPKLPSGG